MMKETPFQIYKSGTMVHRRLVYIYLSNVPSFSSRYFNKTKRTSRLGRLLALSLEILYNFTTHDACANHNYTCNYIESNAYFALKYFMIE